MVPRQTMSKRCTVCWKCGRFTVKVCHYKDMDAKSVYPSPMRVMRKGIKRLQAKLLTTAKLLTRPTNAEQVSGTSLGNVPSWPIQIIYRREGPKTM
ncbi:hypothetical protein LOAG_02651 [Loa loa]|uniref:Uncharacterized protein n=2 Tax=Loa loa TaxID=7209 RepID=A0A1S0U652_LOALO|nr:hypothetical protein LOAG_02651 [Loa loa]EFO25838.1 hypothetical protein LOAG_02651 [Loa loa]